MVNFLVFRYFPESIILKVLGFSHVALSTKWPIVTSSTMWVVLCKLRIVFGVMPQLQRVIMSANFHEQSCVPLS